MNVCLPQLQYSFESIDASMKSNDVKIALTRKHIHYRYVLHI